MFIDKIQDFNIYIVMKMYQDNDVYEHCTYKLCREALCCEPELVTE